MTADLTPSRNDYEALLIGRGLSSDAATTWAFLRHAPGPTTPLVLDVPFEYQDLDIPQPQAVHWFVAGILGKNVHWYTTRGWTAAHLFRLRRAMHDTNQDPLQATTSPLERQHGERTWITTGIPPDLVPLYIHAGHPPGTAQLLDKRREQGDTTIEPALNTLAALRLTDR